jgi:hypothetical protein
MSLRCYAHLKPLARHLEGRTLTLCLSHLPRKRTLPTRRAPRAVHRDVPGSTLEQKQRGHDGDGHRAFAVDCLFGELALPQADDHHPLRKDGR